MRPTMSNNIASRCCIGCRTTTGELFIQTLCPSASAVEAKKGCTFTDLFLAVSPATVALGYLSRGLSVCRVGRYLSHQPIMQGIAVQTDYYMGLLYASPTIHLHPSVPLWMENFVGFVKSDKKDSRMNIAGMSSDAFLQQGNLESIKSKGNTPEGLKEAAESFESVFLNMLLKSMREANEAFGDENLLGGSEEKFYRTMLDGQMAQELGNSGVLVWQRQ